MLHTSLGTCHDTVPLTLLIAFGVFIWAIAVTSPERGKGVLSEKLTAGQDPLLATSDPVQREFDARTTSEFIIL